MPGRTCRGGCRVMGRDPLLPGPFGASRMTSGIGRSQPRLSARVTSVGRVFFSGLRQAPPFRIGSSDGSRFGLSRSDALVRHPRGGVKHLNQNKKPHASLERGPRARAGSPGTGCEDSAFPKFASWSVIAVMVIFVWYLGGAGSRPGQGTEARSCFLPGRITPLGISDVL